MEFAMQQGSLSSPATFFASGFQASRVYCWHRPEAKDASRSGAVPRKGDANWNHNRRTWSVLWEDNGGYVNLIPFFHFSKHVGIATLAWLRWRGRSRVEAGTGRGRMSRELMHFFDWFSHELQTKLTKKVAFFFSLIHSLSFPITFNQRFFQETPPNELPRVGLLRSLQNVRGSTSKLLHLFILLDFEMEGIHHQTLVCSRS